MVLNRFFYCFAFVCFITCSCTKQNDPQNPDNHPPGDSTTSATTDPAVTVYVGGVDSLFSFNAVNGAKKWAVKTGGYTYCSPAYWKGYVYTGSEDSTFYAFDTTGALKWSFRAASYFSIPSPVVDNGIVYINSVDGHVYALDAQTGHLVWSFTGTYSSAGANLVVRNGIVYFNNNILYALDARTGGVLWSFLTGTEVIPVPVGDKLYIKWGVNIAALDAKTGVKLWSKDDYDQFYFAEEMNVSRDGIFTISDGFINCSDTLDGTKKWATGCDRFINAKPVRCNTHY